MELITKPRGDYKCYPEIHPFFKKVDVILDKYIMQPVSRGVLSHPWHWDTLPFDDRFKKYAIPVSGNSRAPKLRKGLFADNLYWLKGHLGAVSSGYLLDVDFGSLQQSIELEDFFYAFSDLQMTSLHRSRIAMNKMFMMLTGSDDWYAYLMDKEGNPLPGKILSPLISWDEKPEGIAIL